MVLGSHFHSILDSEISPKSFKIYVKNFQGFQMLCKTFLCEFGDEVVRATLVEPGIIRKIRAWLHQALVRGQASLACRKRDSLTEVRGPCTCLFEETNTDTSVHSRNTGKLWNYTRNQNLSSPRGGCRAGILTCFHLFKPACVYVFACWCLCWCT